MGEPPRGLIGSRFASPSFPFAISSLVLHLRSLKPLVNPNTCEGMGKGTGEVRIIIETNISKEREVKGRERKGW